MNAQSSNPWLTVLRIASLIVAMALTVMLVLSLGEIWLNLAVATAAVLFGSFAGVGHVAEHRTVIGWALAGGVLLGAVGFTLGFFKPGLFGAEGNLAPLMGVFGTGPIGFVGGTVLGWMAGCIR